MHFLCEEFSQVVSSDVLYELGKEHLLSAIQSDYLQVSTTVFVHQIFSFRVTFFYKINTHSIEECPE